jgi:hypothetical protein
MMVLLLLCWASDVVIIGIKNMFQSFDRVRKTLAVVLAGSLLGISSTTSKSSLILPTDRETSSLFNYPKRKKFDGAISWRAGGCPVRLRCNSSIMAKFHLDMYDFALSI